MMIQTELEMVDLEALEGRVTMIGICVIIIIVLVGCILSYDDKYKDLQHSYELLRYIKDAKDITISNLEKKLDYYESKDSLKH